MRRCWRCGGKANGDEEKETGLASVSVSGLALVRVFLVSVLVWVSVSMIKPGKIAPPISHNFGTNDPMAVHEFYETFKPSGWSDPERMLFLGVLEIAIGDLTGRVPYHNKCAIEWVRGAPGRISFEDCCHALGFDLEATRRKLEDLYSQNQEQKARHVPDLLPTDEGADDHRDGMGLDVRKVR